MDRVSQSESVPHMTDDDLEASPLVVRHWVESVRKEMRELTRSLDLVSVENRRLKGELDEAKKTVKNYEGVISSRRYLATYSPGDTVFIIRIGRPPLAGRVNHVMFRDGQQAVYEVVWWNEGGSVRNTGEFREDELMLTVPLRHPYQPHSEE